MLNFSKSRTIDFDNRDELVDYFYDKTSQSCEMSFANLRMWSEVYSTRMVKYNDDFIFYSQQDQIIYFPIIQNMDLDKLLAIAKSFRDQNICQKITFYDVDPKFIEKYPEVLNYYYLEDNQDDHDYIYDCEKLANLTGAKLKKKRNLVNQFVKLYPDYYVERIDEKNYEHIFNLAKELNEKLEHSEFIDDEDLSMKFAFENFKKLMLDGFILYANSTNIVGFTVYSKLNNSYADIHFEKANHEIKGGSQMLTSLVAKELFDLGFLFVNREQDLGHQGIRQAKLSLDPINLYKRVKLIEK